MPTTVRRWGNSLAIRLPKPFVTQLGIEPGTTLGVAVEDGKLVLTPARPPRFTLRGLLGGVTRRNLHGEIDAGPGVGREGW